MEELKRIKINILSLISILVLAVSPMVCRATFWDDLFADWRDFLPGTEPATSSMEIKNEVNVRANTGGNVIDGQDGEDQIIEGQSRSEIHTKTIINGQEVDSTDINSKDSTSSNVRIENKIEVEDGTATVHKETEINSEKQVEDKEIELKGATETATQAAEGIETENEAGNNIFGSVQNFVTELLNNLKSLFQNIFRF